METVSCYARNCSGQSDVTPGGLSAVPFCDQHASLIPWTVRKLIVANQGSRNQAIDCAKGVCAIADKMRPTAEEFCAMVILL